ncbi:hypothetical protein GALMADRAFT_34165, partial [Galerina marginata CBS 339.88]
MSSATIPTFLPFRGEDFAPSFDVSHPQDLLRYFSDLERLFDHFHINRDHDKKRLATFYVDYSISETWEALPSFFNVDATYVELQEELFDYYPEADKFR